MGKCTGITEEQQEWLAEYLRKVGPKFYDGRYCTFTDINWWCHVSIRHDPDRGGECIDVAYQNNKGVTKLLAIVDGVVDWDGDCLAEYIVRWEFGYEIG